MGSPKTEIIRSSIRNGKLARLPCASFNSGHQHIDSKLTHHTPGLRFVRITELYVASSLPSYCPPLFHSPNMQAFRPCASKALRQTQRRAYSSAVGSYADTRPNLRINKDT